MASCDSACETTTSSAQSVDLEEMPKNVDSKLPRFSKLKERKLSAKPILDEDLLLEEFRMFYFAFR